MSPFRSLSSFRPMASWKPANRSIGRASDAGVSNAGQKQGRLRLLPGTTAGCHRYPGDCQIGQRRGQDRRSVSAAHWRVLRPAAEAGVVTRTVAPRESDRLQESGRRPGGRCPESADSGRSARAGRSFGHGRPRGDPFRPGAARCSIDAGRRPLDAGREPTVAERGRSPRDCRAGGHPTGRAGRRWIVARDPGRAGEWNRVTPAEPPNR